MVTPLSSGPQQVGEAVAAIGVASGMMAWLKPWRWAIALARLTSHDARIKKLEDGAASKATVETMSAEWLKLHEKHVADDARAFGEINSELAHVRENMARRDDLKDVERNLSALMLKGFREAGN